MSAYILGAAAIVISCLFLSKASGKLGVPTLVLFILLGMAFGSDGLLKIHFNDFVTSERICTVALLFIIFYGGFGTRWQHARPVALKAALLSTLGVVLTAGMTGAFCHYILRFSFWESMLVGAVISSTDAASVFSILRSKKLNLKYGTASLLEVESGSNDPCSYMLTFVVLTIMNGNFAADTVWLLIAQQFILGAAFGAATGYIAAAALRRLSLSEGTDAIFVFGIALLAYGGADFAGGNGYLSTYIAGIVLGNQSIPNKKSLVHFFDGTTGLMQIALFFLLGFLSFPSQFSRIYLPALSIALFITFVARPLTIFAILSPFRCPPKQQLLIAWTGLRGAASIVFAIMATVNPAYMHNDVFHITFFIVVFSILVQGSLIPFFAKKLDMIDDTSNVMRTFTDYSEESPLNFVQFTIAAGHPWVNKKIKNITRIPDLLLIMILRTTERILPRGNIVILEGDRIVLTTLSAESVDGLLLSETEIASENSWIGQALEAIAMPNNTLIVAIRRDKAFFIPNGQTVIREKDILVLSQTEALCITKKGLAC